MKTNITQSIKILILAGFLVGASVFAGPSSNFPTGNMAAPINAGPKTQIKSGGLAVGGLAVFGTTNGSATFGDHVTLSNGSNLYVSGKLNVGVNPPSGLDVSGEALLNIQGTIQTSSLSHTGPFNLIPVCQNGGVLQLCAIKPPTVPM